MEAKNSDHRLNECEIAWLTVEKDLNAKLQTPESLKYGKQALHLPETSIRCYCCSTGRTPVAKK